MKINFLLFLLSLFLVLPVQAADNSKPLKGKDLENAQAMNNIYARHILTSSCINSRVAYSMLEGITSEEKSLRIRKFKKDCDCVAEIVMKKYSPNDVIDYVTDASGEETPQNNGNASQKEKFADISYLMNVDKKTHKACGSQK